MFRSIFRPYGLVWTVLNTVTDVVGLTLCWLLCCLPVVTLFPATAALYDAVVHGIRYREEGPYKRFFRTFRAEWKSGILSTLLWGAVLGFFGYLLAVLLTMAWQDSGFSLYAGVYLAGMLLPIGAACWSAALGIAACTVALAVFIWNYPIWIFAAPACLMLLWSVFAEPVFAKYGAAITPVTPDED